jgi:Zn-dependent protease with chaperone function
MPISDEQFDALVARLAKDADRNPFAYKARVFLLAMLGYAYVFGILLGIIAILVGVILIVRTGRGVILLKNVAIPLAIFAWVVGKALWVKLSPPAGRPLRREEAPQLFADMAEICRKLDAPRADVVLLTDDYNAAVSQVPRLGVFGWHRNYLIVGIPLMQALPPDEWRGILAHEFSHLSRAHARFSNWIYRVRKTWFQLMHTLENERQGGGAWLFKGFFHWYAPYFGAYSFVLARRDEYEADKLAASVVGADVMARGFIASSVRGRQLSESFWPEVRKEVVTHREPPADVHSRMATRLRAPLDAAPVQAWISDELAVETGSADTHPATRDRIAALGVDVRQLTETTASAASPIAVTAAEHYLGGVASSVTRELDARWRNDASSWWAERHEAERAQEAQLTDLEQRHASLNDEDLWNLARLADARKGAEAAESYLRELLTRTPRHAAASYTLGYNLLASDDEEGVGLIETAMDIDPEAIGPGSRTIAGWLRHRGRTDEATRYELRAAEAEVIQAESARERDSVYRTDTFTPHEVDDATLAPLRAALAKQPRIKAAWLVRKTVKHMPERPLYVLGFDPGFDWRGSLRAGGLPIAKTPDDGYPQALANLLPLPGEAFVVPLHAENAWLRKKMKKVAGAKIYP